MSNNTNLGWLFYKELYRNGDDSSHIKNKLAKIKKASGIDKDKLKLGEHGFTLSTTYPGLIIGSGYTHGISSDDDVKIGFYFDYTTGLPQLPGSSVKGVLRSFFKRLDNEDETDLVLEFFEETCKEVGISKTIDIAFLKKVEDEIFEGINSETKKPLPMYSRDKFFDAVIVEVGDDGLLSEDYITPHKEPLKNPVPIKILKVSGGVSFQFQFDLKDSKSDGLKASEKELLFLKLLFFSGIGAKTNVGYGQFQEWSEEEIQKFIDKDKQKEISKQLENATNEFDKLKIKLERIKKPKPIFDNIKKIADSLSSSEKEELKKIVDAKIANKTLDWYKKIMEILI